jgi:hypothetical protein
MSSAPSDEQDAANETEARIRRAPKYPAFIIVGGGIGAIVTFILTASFPVDPKVGFGALFGYFALYGVTAGVLVGAVLALILDRRGSRRSRPATVVTELADDGDPEVYVTDEAAPVAEPGPVAEPAPVAEPVEAPPADGPPPAEAPRA